MAFAWVCAFLWAPDSTSARAAIARQQTSHSTSGGQRSAAAISADVLATEEVIENLRAQMATLSASAANLQLPDQAARALFQPIVAVTDIGAAPSESRADELGLDLVERDWPPAKIARSARLEDLALLRPLFDRIYFFHHVKFYTRKGEFSNQERTIFRADSGFKGLAQLANGAMAHATAEVNIVWRGEAETLGVGWRISSIEFGNVQLLSTERPFFTDVLDHALNPAARSAARRSIRDEGLIGFVNGVRCGELDLDELLEQFGEAVFAHTEPMHMSHLCVVDLDRDGFDDFYVCPSNSMAQFFHNRGDGTFEEVAEKLGLGLERVEAATFADFDNDGDADAFLSFAPWKTHYYANEDGHFVDRSALTQDGFPQLAFSISPMDYNGDGLLDVYFSRYNGFWLGAVAAQMEAARAAGTEIEIAFPGMEKEESAILYDMLFAEGVDPFVSRPGPPNRLFRNLGNGRFEHADGADAAEQYTQSLSATWSDFDLDGDMDLYVVTEAAANQMIRNNGDGSFTDITDSTTADVGFGMGLGIGDYDNDGRQDVYVTNMYSKAGLRISEQIGASELIKGAARGNSLLHNGVDGWQRVSGVKEPAILVEAADFGWGGAFADFNNDGTLDLYAPAGYVTMPEAVEGVGET